MVGHPTMNGGPPEYTVSQPSFRAVVGQAPCGPDIDGWPIRLRLWVAGSNSFGPGRRITPKQVWGCHPVVL